MLDFLLDEHLKSNLFILKDKQISGEQYQRDVSLYMNTFLNIPAQIVSLYIPNDVYLFYVLFRAAMFSKKDVVLLPLLSDSHLEALKQLTDTIVTNQNISFPGIFCIKPKMKPYQMIETHADVNERTIYFFTSGSTGKPKCIKKAMNCLMYEVMMHHEMQHINIEQNPIVLASIAPYHMYGMLWRLLFSIYSGLTQDLDTIFYPEELIFKQALYQKIIFITTPSFMGEISAYPKPDAFKKNCVTIFSSGSLLKGDLSQKIKELLGAAPFEIYGSTETGGVAYRKQDETDLWTVFPKVDIEVDEQSCLAASSPFSISSPYVLGDSVTPTAPRQFILNGRIDRIVKIAEKKLSLAQIEDYLNKWEYVKSSYFITYENEQRTCLAVLVCLTDKGKDYVLHHSRSSFVLEMRSYLRQAYESAFLPKKVRLIEKIPTNSQGKILKSEVLSIVHSRLQEPIVLNLEHNQNNLSADLYFDDALDYFKGHFPNFPVLPGVMQLHFAFHFMKLYFNAEFKKYKIHKLKFTNLIEPNKLVCFSLCKLTDTEYSFLFGTEEKPYSSGRIVKDERDDL